MEKVFLSWYIVLKDLIKSDYFNKLLSFLESEYKSKNISPDKKDVFKCFRNTHFNNLKIVILGKDPYPNNKATGLAFANKDEVGGKLSPSLSKIKNCIENNVYKGLNIDFNPELTHWTEQGVLLLNTALTVEKGNIGSHHKYWNRFTLEVLKTINDRCSGIIFMFWGKDAYKYEEYISDVKHYKMYYNHPSWAAYNDMPWNCNHFVKANKLIEENNGRKFCIEW